MQNLNQTLNEATFCIVDIETNGGKAHRDNIIEIGAVLVKNGKVIETFESLIHADKLPKNIEELTGITMHDLYNAPQINSVMQEFQTFIQDHIIVAHPLTFDYNFISASFEKAGLNPMDNAGVCNIALAERTLSSAKYGLHYLNKTLKLEEEFQHHRAYHDAVITKDIFLKCLDNLPEHIETVKNLIEFTKKAKKKPRAALQVFD